MSASTYDKIEEVIRQVTLNGTVEAIAPHEFALLNVSVRPDKDGGPEYYMMAREYVGCSESTLARRMREMCQMGRLTRKVREGKNFKEFALAPSWNGGGH